MLELHLGGHLNFYDPQKRPHIRIALDQSAGLAMILEGLGVPLGEIAIAVVNGEMVEPATALVKPGDRIELFPPMGGG